MRTRTAQWLAGARDSVNLECRVKTRTSRPACWQNCRAFERSTLKGHENRTQTVVYDLDWGLIDNGVFQYRPSEVGIRKPLQIGKEWRWDVNAINMRDGGAWRTSGVAKVVGQEKITTQGGGFFDTFRVEAKGQQVSVGNQNSADGDPGVWYAPAVNRW